MPSQADAVPTWQKIAHTRLSAQTRRAEETKRLYRAPVDLVDATAAESIKRLLAALSLAVVGCLVPDVDCVQHATAHFPGAFPHSQSMSWGTVPV